MAAGEYADSAGEYADIGEWPLCRQCDAVVTADALHMREAPRLDATSCGLLQRGERVSVWCRDGNWLLVQAADWRPGRSGWSFAEYLQRERAD